MTVEPPIVRSATGPWLPLGLAPPFGTVPAAVFALPPAGARQPARRCRASEFHNAP
jgi:hypothetical protein